MCVKGEHSRQATQFSSSNMNPNQTPGVHRSGVLYLAKCILCSSTHVRHSTVINPSWVLFLLFLIFLKEVFNRCAVSATPSQVFAVPIITEVGDQNNRGESVWRFCVHPSQWGHFAQQRFNWCLCILKIMLFHYLLLLSTFSVEKTFFIFLCLCSHCLTVFFYLGECLPLLLDLLHFSEETS